MLINLARITGRCAAHLRPNIRFARCFTQMCASWPEGVKKFFERECIKEPTMIQEKTLPIVMDNKNLVGIARTGSGKTLAFVLPAVMRILKDRENGQEKKSSCLILAPTRELANQIADVVKKFTYLGLHVGVLVGGSSRGEQVRQLESRTHDIYVATPGRLIDLVETQTVDLSTIKYLVLDEADRMLDMGFEPQIRQILQTIPKDRQTLMWSATWPPEIRELASEFLNNYEYVAVDSAKLKANPNIRQEVVVCQPHEKLKIMLEHFKQFSKECSEPKFLVFVNTKRLADSLLIQLMRHRFKAIALHGDRTQKQRDDAMRLFKNKLCNVMIATDVAARGLDISDISHVINFDFPKTIEDYIHRIGRTARHTKTGVALSLFTDKDESLSKKLVQVLQETNQTIPPELINIRASRFRRRVNDIFE